MLTPVTVPPTTEADELLLLQAPPNVVLDKVIVKPTQTFENPVITPASVTEPTFIVFVDVAVPQTPVTA